IAAPGRRPACDRPPMAVRYDLAVNRLLPILTIADLRDVERRHAHEPLMERAGAAAADIAAAMLGARRDGIVVLAGPGNNGGDAFVCARLLRERGLQVDVVAHDVSHLPPQAATAFARLQKDSLPVSSSPPARMPALIIDGLFGVGLNRPVA